MKTSKSSVWAHIEQLESSVLDDRQRELVNVLKMQFFPSKPNRPKTRLEWLALACAKPGSNCRPYAEMIYCDDERAYATDGHLIHVSPSEFQPVGWHTPKGDHLPDNNTVPPQYERVIPKIEECEEIDFTDLTPETHSLKLQTYSYNGLYYNAKKVLTSHAFDFGRVYVAPNQALVFTHHYGMAVLMPTNEV